MHRFLTLLIACDGSTTPASPTSPEDTDDSGTPDAEDSAEPEDTGWECNPWYPCQECGGAQCGATLGPCAGDGVCSAALNAWAACVLACGNPRTCADDFAAAGGSLAGPLLTCVEASCADVCDLAD